MSGRGILDADMHSLARLIVQAWRWWINELGEMVPASLRHARRSDLPALVFEGGRLVSEEKGKGAVGRGAKRRRRVAIIVPRHLCLSRTIERPATNDRDLQRMLSFEAETLLPFPLGATLLAGRATGPALAPGRVMLEVAGLPMDIARAIAAVAEEENVLPVRVLLQDARGARDQLDFAPAMRQVRLVTKARSATPLIWACVGVLIALNLAMLIWRDAASVDRLEGLVQDQQPAVRVAQTIARRADGYRTLVTGSLRLRSQHDALGGLAVVSEALPGGVWLQRYMWDGPTVRLTGYRPSQMDVATALRRSGRFADVRSMADEGQETLPVGDPFDLTARIVKR